MNELDAGRRGRRLRAHADSGAAGAVPGSPAGADWARPQARSATAGRAGGGHGRIGGAFLTGVHAKPTEGADFEAGISIDQIAAAQLGQQHAAGLARARPRARPNSPAPATPDSAAPTPTRSAGGPRPRRCRWRTTRARCSSGCSATATAPTRPRGGRDCRSSAAFSTR